MEALVAAGAGELTTQVQALVAVGEIVTQIQILVAVVVTQILTLVAVGETRTLWMEVEEQIQMNIIGIGEDLTQILVHQIETMEALMFITAIVGQMTGSVKNVERIISLVDLIVSNVVPSRMSPEINQIWKATYIYH